MKNQNVTKGMRQKQTETENNRNRQMKERKAGNLLRVIGSCEADGGKETNRIGQDSERQKGTRENRGFIPSLIAARAESTELTEQMLPVVTSSERHVVRKKDLMPLHIFFPE